MRITHSIEIPDDDLDYDFSRSGGPGGQHVNKTDTRVRLTFALGACSVLSDAVKDRLRRAKPEWLTKDDRVVITSERTRSRKMNIEDANLRLIEAIRAALVPPKKRTKTKPTKGSKQRRLNEKKSRSDIKEKRKRVERE